MLRRLIPLFATILSMLLDTSVIPVFYHGVFTVPLTLITTMCIGLLRGRLRGLLWGMVGGLLIDITAGTLGFMTLFFMIAGFLTGFLVDESVDRPITGVMFHVRRAAVTFILSLLGEVVFTFYQYFNTAVFEWSTAKYLVIRSLITSVGVVVLCPLLDRMITGRKSRSDSHAPTGPKREVKYF